MKNGSMLCLSVGLGFACLAPARGLTLDEVTWTGDWRDGIGITFSNGNETSFDLHEEFGAQYFQVIGGSGDEFPNSILVGVAFGDGIGPLEVDLQFAYWGDGAEAFVASYIPAGWEAQHLFGYDSETLTGSLTWSFTGSDQPTNVPDGAPMMGLLGLGALGMLAGRRLMV